MIHKQSSRGRNRKHSQATRIISQNKQEKIRELNHLEKTTIVVFFSLRAKPAGVIIYIYTYVYTRILKRLIGVHHIHIQLSHSKAYHQSINQRVF